MTTPVLWPTALCRPAGWTAGYDPLAASGGRTALSGRLDNVQAPGRGIWRPAYVDVPIWTRAAREAIGVMEGLVLGRDTPVLVPYHHGGIGPFQAPREASTFDDGAEHEDASLVAPRTVALVRRDASAGAVTVRIDKVDCGTIRPLHAFSVGTGLYRVRSVEEQSDAFAIVEIYPELRSDIAEGDWVEFDRPIVKCRLLDPRALSAEWTAGFKSVVTVQFIEDTTP